MRREVCVGCSREYKILENGVYVVRIYEDRGKPFEVWCADMWICRSCGNTITTGYGKEALAYSHEEHFDKVLEDIKDQDDRTVVEVYY